jgi:hypothetical protein
MLGEAYGNSVMKKALVCEWHEKTSPEQLQGKIMLEVFLDD